MFLEELFEHYSVPDIFVVISSEFSFQTSVPVLEY